MPPTMASIILMGTAWSVSCSPSRYTRMGKFFIFLSRWVTDSGIKKRYALVTVPKDGKGSLRLFLWSRKYLLSAIGQVWREVEHRSFLLWREYLRSKVQHIKTVWEVWVNYHCVDWEDDMAACLEEHLLSRLKYFLPDGYVWETEMWSFKSMTII